MPRRKEKECLRSLPWLQDHLLPSEVLLVGASSVMVGNRERSTVLIKAYNRQDFAAMEALIAPALDFAHFNRNFAMTRRDELIGVLRTFAADYIPDRRFEEPERILESGDMVIREAWYTGTPLVDLPGFGAQGESFRLKFCSVMRFDEAGMLAEWKDYG